MNEELNYNKEKGIKKYFLRNNYNLMFSVLSLISLIFFILNATKTNLGIGFLDQIINLFPTTIWFLFFISLVASSALAYFGKYKLMVLPIFIWLLIFTVQIRTSNIPQLIDVTTENYTLGPDLDPFLYLRQAHEINQGALSDIDKMRYAPLGAASFAKRNLMPWIIVGVYKIISLFTDTSITYAAIISPVILFIISLIGFFLFVQSIFSFKLDRGKSYLIALIASIFYAFSPQMLHRTVAGIPEIESLGMASFWFAFLFFTLAWKNKKNNLWIIFGAIAGIFTGLMSWSWGGYRYIYMILSLTCLIIFLFEKDVKKNLLIFSSWLIPALIIEFTRVESITSIIGNLPCTGFAIGIFGLLLIQNVVPKLKIKFLKKINLPTSLTVLLITIVLGVITLLVINPKLIVEIISKVIGGLLFPFGRERVGLTVAENKAPYLIEAISQFGYIIWAFLFGIFLLFYESVKHFEEKKKKGILIFSFLILVSCIAFSRISSISILNGENLLSQIVYIGGILVFVSSLLYLLIKSHREKDEKTIENFRKIDISYLILLSFSFWAIVSMRGAIRLFFIISPMIILIASFLPIKLFEYKKETKDELLKMILIMLIIAAIFVFVFSFIQYSQSTIIEAQRTAPGIYEQQWQRAMQWVREKTPESSIFVHWWDYGYWIQTLGERPTVTDGGHAIGYWDHLIGRYLLTTTEPEVAESLMKSYNATYLLIDSTDLGKYPAYSKIGSDDNFDKFSAIPLMSIDKSQIRETNDSVIMVYQGTGGVDEDIIYISEEQEIIVPGPTYDSIGNPSYKAFVVGVILEKNTKAQKFSQPKAVFVYNQKQIIIPIRYLYYKGELRDYGGGLESVYMLIPQLYSSNQGIQLEEIGSGIYLSPKVSKSLFAQVYLLNNSFGKYNNFELVHSEEDVIMINLKAQGVRNIGEFIDYQGFRGPIKIWKLKENPKIIPREEFLRTSGGYAEFDNLTFTK